MSCFVEAINLMIGRDSEPLRLKFSRTLDADVRLKF